MICRFVDLGNRYLVKGGRRRDLESQLWHFLHGQDTSRRNRKLYRRPLSTSSLTNKPPFYLQVVIKNCKDICPFVTAAFGKSDQSYLTSIFDIVAATLTFSKFLSFIPLPRECRYSRSNQPEKNSSESEEFNWSHSCVERSARLPLTIPFACPPRPSFPVVLCDNEHNSTRLPGMCSETGSRQR